MKILTPEELRDAADAVRDWPDAVQGIVESHEELRAKLDELTDRDCCTNCGRWSDDPERPCSEFPERGCNMIRRDALFEELRWLRAKLSEYERAFSSPARGPSSEGTRCSEPGSAWDILIKDRDEWKRMATTADARVAELAAEVLEQQATIAQLTKERDEAPESAARQRAISRDVVVSHGNEIQQLREQLAAERSRREAAERAAAVYRAELERIAADCDSPGQIDRETYAALEQGANLYVDPYTNAREMMVAAEAETMKERERREAAEAREARLREALGKLVRHCARWGSEEDGIPEEMWVDFQSAKALATPPASVAQSVAVTEGQVKP